MKTWALLFFLLKRLEETVMAQDVWINDDSWHEAIEEFLNVCYNPMDWKSLF